MKRNHVYGLTAAMAIAACSAVQIHASQDMSGTAAKSETVVTGCLVSGDERGTAGATGTSGSTAGITATPGHFKLTDAVVSRGTASRTDTSSSSAGGSTAAGATGTSGSAMHPSFVLVGKDNELKENLNSRVEVRGTIQANAFSTEPAAGAAGGTTTGGTTTGDATATGTGVGATGTGSSVTASAMAQTLRVTSVKKISGSCTQ